MNIKESHELRDYPLLASEGIMVSDLEIINALNNFTEEAE